MRNRYQVQNDYFHASARYVRVTVTGLPSGVTASVERFQGIRRNRRYHDHGAACRLTRPVVRTAFDATEQRLERYIGWRRESGGRQNRQCRGQVSGTNQYVALPSGVVSGDDTITIAAWVNLDSVSNWTRIFDFGSGFSTNMFLTPKNGANGKIRFGIKNNGSRTNH